MRRRPPKRYIGWSKSRERHACASVSGKSYPRRRMKAAVPEFDGEKFMARSYVCIDRDCTVVLERDGEPFSAAVKIMVNAGGNRTAQTLTPHMMERLCQSLAFCFEGHTGRLPRLPGDRNLFMSGDTHEPMDTTPATQPRQRTRAPTLPDAPIPVEAPVRVRTRQR